MTLPTALADDVRAAIADSVHVASEAAEATDRVLALLEAAAPPADAADPPEPTNGDDLLTEFSGAALETHVQSATASAALRWGRVGAAVLEIHLRELRAHRRRTLDDLADILDENVPRDLDRRWLLAYLRSEEAPRDLLLRRLTRR